MSNYKLPVGQEDDERLKYQSKTLEKITHTHLADAGLNMNSIVADIGCGNGDIVCYLLTRCHTIYAIDQSQQQLDMTRVNVEKYKVDNNLCHQKTANVIYIQYDLCTSAQNNDSMMDILGSVDIVFMRFVLMHIKSNEYLNVFQNIHHILKIGGKFLNEEAVFNNIYCNKLEYLVNEYKNYMIERAIKNNQDYNIGQHIIDVVPDNLFDTICHHVIDRPITTLELKTMFNNVLSILKKTTESISDLKKFESWESQVNTLDVDDPTIFVKTSGTGILTCEKI